MSILALGINHKTAPVNIRERIAFDPLHLPNALVDLQTQDGVNEAVILSTCNRTELYCNVQSAREGQIIQWLGNYHTLAPDEFHPYLYQHPQQLAVKHVLRVASGLDSMVLGEPQILGQVKSAYHTANEAGTLGTLLERLFQHTFSVAKQVRTDTRIGESPVSVAFAAVNLSKRIFADLSQQTALLIGAGETIELVARHLDDNNIGRIIVANRTFERARELASNFSGFAIGLNEITDHLDQADIIISSTASPNLILDHDQVKRSLKKRKHRPVFMVDIAVPRDLDPKIADLADAYLYTVDDLQEIIQENLRSRESAAAQAEDIIDNQVETFMSWLRIQDSSDTIRALRAQAESIRDELLVKAQNQLQQGKPAEQVMASLANALTNKLIHPPSAGLRDAAGRGDADTLAILKQLYHIKSGKPS